MTKRSRAAIDAVSPDFVPLALRPHTVYMRTCLASGMRYIGVTSLSLDERWQGCCTKAKQGKPNPLSCHIREHGETGWITTILGVYPSKRAGDEAEIKAIAHHGTQWPNGGLNVDAGGTYGALGLKRRPEARARIAASMKVNRFKYIYCTFECWLAGSSVRHIVPDLKSFCNQHGLRYTNMIQVAQGQRLTHGGWCCRKIHDRRAK